MGKGRGSTKIKRVAKAGRPVEPLVNPFAAAHGAYELSTVVDLSGELGGKRNSMVKVMFNRGGTTIERWMSEDGSKLFGEGERSAIRYCQSLWSRAEGLPAIGTERLAEGYSDGWSQQEALTELSALRGRFPGKYWDVFENVCRFDVVAGQAGSMLANNDRARADGSKVVVAFVAGMIAIWRRM